MKRERNTGERKISGEENGGIMEKEKRKEIGRDEWTNGRWHSGM